MDEHKIKDFRTSNLYSNECMQLSLHEDIDGSRPHKHDKESTNLSHHKHKNISTYKVKQEK